MTVFLTIGLKAQITISSSSMPSIGDTIRYSNGAPGSFDFTTKGANYNWNFYTIGFTGQAVYKYQALTSTPYSTLAFTGMPLGSIGFKVADSIGQGQTAIKNIYNFYEKKSTAWNAVGTGFTLSAIPFPAGGVYSDKDEIYKFPLNYDDYDSSTFQVTTLLGNQIFNMGSYKQKGYRINKVEGWGKITTPYATNVNCIKIKSIIVEDDTLKIPTASINFGFQNNRVEYKWLSTTEKIPMLEVTGTEIGGSFTPTIIRYRDNYRVAAPSPLAPKIKFIVNKTSGVTQNDTFKFTNSTTPSFGTTYFWSITPSTGVRYVKGTSATSTNPAIVFDNAGTYSVKLAASNLLGSSDSTATNMITVTQSSGVSNKIVVDNNTYPNPFNESVHFDNPQFAGLMCRIFNVSGQEIIAERIADNLTINTTSLAAGVYTIVVAEGDVLYYRQMIKQ